MKLGVQPLNQPTIKDKTIIDNKLVKSKENANTAVISNVIVSNEVTKIPSVKDSKYLYKYF